jgi:MFS transporter, OFA family, oxalate/formate antiporter
MVGVSIMCVSILMASLQKTWITFVLFYCIGFPIGIGIVYFVPLMCGWEWFPDNKGLVSGLVVGGFGFGAFIFGYITTAIVNPDNVKTAIPEDGSGDMDKLFPKSVSDKVPYMYHFCLVIWAILGILAACGVSRNPEYVQKEKIKERRETI